MLDDVRLLFREVVDLSLEDRETYYQKHQIPADLRAEVEQFLAFDGGSNHLLTEPVAVCAAGLADETEERLNERRCGPYRLLHLIGSGGMGSVYLAQRVDGEVEQRVAIKLLKYGADDPAFRSRFLQERQILAKLNHPAIGRLLDAGHTADGQPYLAMDYIDGVPIDVYCETLDLRDKLVLFRQVCDAVSYAHRNLIVHRDLKPSNILVDPEGQPKLLDFRDREDSGSQAGPGAHLYRTAGVDSLLCQPGTDTRRGNHDRERRLLAGRVALQTADGAISLRVRGTYACNYRPHCL